jgi:hypothetical protein
MSIADRLSRPAIRLETAKDVLHTPPSDSHADIPAHAMIVVVISVINAATPSYRSARDHRHSPVARRQAMP